MKKLSITFLVVFLLVQAIVSQPVEVGAKEDENIPLMVGANDIHTAQGFTILSPIEGSWANKQALVLEVPENCDVFYSFSGSHPMDSGFAYDGPVMLEAQGNVSLKIALVFPYGNAIVYTVNYSVVVPKNTGKPNFEFNLNLPLVSYSLGQEIKIPAGYSYRLGESKAFLLGEQTLSLAGGTFPRRYIPCEVTDGDNSWRFIISPDGVVSSSIMAVQSQEQLSSIEKNEMSLGNVDSSEKLKREKTVAGVGGTFIPYEFYFAPDSQGKEIDSESSSQKTESSIKGNNLQEPPFQISNWNILNFSNRELLYAIDDGYWQGVSDSLVLDRSVGHTIYWQSIAYDPKNPVYSFYLPPRPSHSFEFKGREAVTLALGSDFTIKPSNSDLNPLPSLHVDAFYGEELESDFTIDVYYKGLYQGKEYVHLSIDKCPPAPPQIESNSDLFYNRNEVQITLNELDGGKVFYSVDLLVSQETGFKELVLDIDDIAVTPRENFLSYDGTPIVLESHRHHAHHFLVQAFSQDEYGNSSSIVEYQTIVDPVNYYVETPSDVNSSPASTSTESMEEILADGGISNPFTSLQEALSKTENLNFARIHIKGILSLDEVITISSHREIIGDGLISGINFMADGGLVIHEGQVTLHNCIIESQVEKSTPNQQSPIFSVLKGNFSLINCEILGDYKVNGTLISSVDSSLSVIDSNITMRAGRYGAIISARGSSLSISGGRFTVVAPTAVAFSLSAGDLMLSNSNCKVFGQLGRVAELTGVEFSLLNNSFQGIFENISVSSAKLVPVWQDKRSKLIENTGNEISGFPGS